MRALALVLIGSLLPLTAVAAPPVEWQVYSNEKFGYEIELPLGMFTGSRDGDNGITLLDSDGQGEIRVYGGVNARELSPRELEATLSGSDRIGEVTYARRGSSWFVLSGYSPVEDPDGESLIFYTKLMFSPDRRLLSAFEASYPISDKRRYDAIIERMEDSLTPPRAE
jgi:hypothetical protein